MTRGKSLSNRNSKPTNSTSLRAASRRIVSLPRRYGIRPGSKLPFFLLGSAIRQNLDHTHALVPHKRSLETRRFRAIRSRPRIRGIILKCPGLSRTREKMPACLDVQKCRAWKFRGHRFISSVSYTRLAHVSFYMPDIRYIVVR